MEQPDPWQGLRKFTAARIALGRAGTSIPLEEFLHFRLAHAHARDAVYSMLDQPVLEAGLQALQMPYFVLHSQAGDRHQYLQRPDLGRLPDEQSRQTLEEWKHPADISLVLGDGLSATALNSHALPLLTLLIPLLTGAGYTLTPVCMVRQARVAIADPVAHALQAKLSLMLIGERPGLTAADSLGAYLTYHPRPGLTDESRNCVSNIRPQGLSYEAAAHRIYYLIRQSLTRQLSGVLLKDDMERLI